MSWIILSFGSVIFFTSLNLLQRVIAVNSKTPRAMAILFNAIAAIIAILIFAVTGAFKNFSLPTTPKAWFVLLTASFCYAMFDRGRFTAAKLLDASFLTTIVNISVIVAFAGALFFYSERITVNKILGSILIISALFLVSIHKEAKKTSRKGIVIAVIISIMLGLGWILDKQGAQLFNPITYNILIWVVPIIFIYFPGIKFEAVKTELKLASWKVILLAGLNVTGYLMQLKALAITEATKVIPIVQTSTIFTVLMGIFLLKEKEYVFRKIIASLIAVSGVYLLII